MNLVELDAVTAAALRGAEVFAEVGSSGGFSCDSDASTASGRLAASACRGFGDDEAAADIEGQIFTQTGRWWSISVGIVKGSAAVSGDGIAEIGADGPAEGDVIVTRTTTNSIPGTHRQVGCAIGFAFDHSVMPRAMG